MTTASSTTIDRPVRAYAFWASREDGSLSIDTLYIDPADDKRNGGLGGVWDAQENYGSAGNRDRLPMLLDRSWAVRWLSIRRTAPNSILSGNCRLHTSREIAVPHKPFGPYADPDKIVLHEEHPGDFSGYGRKSGISESGAAYTETRLDSDSYDLDYDEDALTEEDRAADPEWYLGPVLENCAQCDAPMRDGADCWLCLDGGEYYCPDHILLDYRPGALFTRVGAIRGEHLPEFAWPGGYLIAYYTRQGSVTCADCASSPGKYSQDDSDPVESAEALEGDYAEDHGLEAIPLCESCNRPIDPADRKSVVE
jgi:hypothetical protein